MTTAPEYRFSSLPPIDEEGALVLNERVPISQMVAWTVSQTRRFCHYVRTLQQNERAEYMVVESSRTSVEDLWHNSVLLSQSAIGFALPHLEQHDAGDQSRTRARCMEAPEFTGRAGGNHPLPRDIFDNLNAIVFTWPLPEHDVVPKHAIETLERAADYLESHGLHHDSSPRENPSIQAPREPSSRAQSQPTATGQMKLAPSVRLAWLSHQRAIEHEPRLVDKGDKAIHQWLQLHDPVDDYVLPPFRTWRRYVTSARGVFDCRKKESRIGRTGRSIVRADGCG